jgi:hypothetical protein
MKYITPHPQHCRVWFTSHRVDQSTKLSLQSSELGLHPPLPPPTRRPVCTPPPPFGSGRRAHSLAGEGMGAVPILTRGQTLWYFRYICTLCLQYFHAVLEEEPVIEGQLKEKKGGKWKIFKKWKSRYFTLSGTFPRITLFIDKSGLACCLYCTKSGWRCIGRLPLALHNPPAKWKQGPIGT